MTTNSLPQEPVAGSLVVASPTLEDPNFVRTVVLLLAAGSDEGAMGVVLNRPNEVPVGALLPGWEDLAAEPSSVFVGGPVSREFVICLAHLEPGLGGAHLGCSPVPGLDGLATLDLHRSPEEMAGAVRAVRLFSGYSGWSAGQLESEIEAGGWLILTGTLDDAFSNDPDGLWRRILRRQGGTLAMYANAPPNLSMN